MRLNLLLFLLLMISYIAQAQIPNGDFESWTNGSPDSWIVNNVPGYETVIQTTFSYSGYALEGQVVSYLGFGNLTPVIISENGTGQGFTISQSYKSLKGYYAFKPQGGDIMNVTVLLSDANSLGVAGGAIQITNTSDNYTTFAVPIIYTQGGGTPTSCIITFAVSGPASGGEVHAGTQMFIDNLELSMDDVSGVEEKNKQFDFALNQNYPNPFNPSTTISYQIPVTSRVSLKVYDIIGNEVAALVNEVKPAGKYETTFNAADLPSGIYFYQLKTNGYNKVRKMILLR
jgi:hypothetical protein